MAKKIVKNFDIAASVKAEVSIRIEAENYQDALEKAKELKVTDFISTDGDFNDYELIGISYIGSGEPMKL